MSWNDGRRNNGGAGGPGPSPLGLYRDPENGFIAGVCAGIAEWTGLEPKLVRLAAIGGLIFFFPATFIAYCVLAFMLKPKPRRLFDTPEDAVFWQGVGAEPEDAVAGLVRKFRAMEERLRRIEAHILSEEFELGRKFRDIER